MGNEIIPQIRDNTLRTPTDGVSGADALKVLKLIKYSKMNREPVEGQHAVM